MIDRLDQQLAVATPFNPGGLESLPGGSYAAFIGAQRPGAGEVPRHHRQRARTPGEGSRRVFEQRRLPHPLMGLAVRAGRPARRARHAGGGRAAARRERDGQRADPRRGDHRGVGAGAGGRYRLLVGGRGHAPAGADRGHGRPDRRRRPLPARGRDRSRHRGRPARDRAERHADPDRAGVRRAAGVREPAATVRGRRLPRAAHAADLGARLRGAVPAGSRRPARRPGERDAPDRGGVGAHGGAGRRPAAAGPARPGPPAGTGAGRLWCRW